MLGDGICDEACYVNECVYDYNDCGCSSDCHPTDYGTCKEECLNYRCYYDQISEDSSKRCNNKDLVKLALHQHLIYRNFQKTPGLILCTDNAYGCTKEMALDTQNCHIDCDYIDCAYAWVNCPPKNSLVCFSPHCKKCYNEG